MRITAPTDKEISALTGPALFEMWQGVTDFVLASYKNLTLEWHTGGKAGVYECKFRKGGKTICSLFAREKGLGFMVIFGKEERAAFEEQRASFPKDIQKKYDAAKTFHDGKWVMFNTDKKIPLTEFKKLTYIKRKPDLN
ncbi:hypothetical protein Dip510_000298 [Elusimicrobium posterum]|uniref:DUF3788 domain-containing protein n=1 Tax=Elusimicrobium posterum TaxID=3116653 RepID=UPI003C76C200